MRIHALFIAICLAVVSTGLTVADEYFELYAGTTVWAKTSFRLRKVVSVEACARTCVQTPRCSSFVYSRMTRFCYGRKNTDARSRRHWHRNRRYDFYQRLNGSDRTRIEEVIPDSGQTEIVFVRRGTYRNSDSAFSAPALVEYKRLDEFGRQVDVASLPRRPPLRIPIIRPTTPTTTVATADVRRTRPTTTTRRTWPTTTKRTRPTTTTRRTRPNTTTRRTWPTTTRRTRPTTTTRRTRPTTTTRRTRPTTTTRRTRPTTTTRRTTTPFEEACEDRPIGLEDGTFPLEKLLSASSSFWRFLPSNVAINSGNGWMASTTNKGEYLEVDLETPRRIVAVATQGSSYLFSNEFVSQYKLKFLLHPTGIFETYKEYGREVIFDGNDDQLTVVKNRLKIPVRAYKMQIHPLKFYNNIMLRLEVYEEC